MIAGAPVVLFPTRIFGGGVDTQQGRQYDVARDGRCLINTVLGEAFAPITLLQNGHPETRNIALARADNSSLVAKWRATGRGTSGRQIAVYREESWQPRL